MRVFSKVKVSDAEYRKLKSDFSILIAKFLKQSELESDIQSGRFASFYAFEKKGDLKKCSMLINEIGKHQSEELNKKINII